MAHRKPNLKLASSNGQRSEPPEPPPSGRAICDRIDAQYSRLVTDVAELLSVCIHALPQDTQAGAPEVRRVLMMVEGILNEVTTQLEEIGSDARQLSGAA